MMSALFRLGLSAAPLLLGLTISGCGGGDPEAEIDVNPDAMAPAPSDMEGTYETEVQDN